MAGKSIRIYCGLKDYYSTDAPISAPTTMSDRSPGPEILDIHSVKVLEGLSLNGTYSEIETLKIDARQTNFVSVSQYQSPANWFKLVFVDPDGAELATTDPLVAEEIGTIVDDVRAEIGDTDSDNPAFSDDEYLRRVRLAMRRYKGEKNLSYIEEQDIPVIALLVRADICRVIAYDHAKYYALAAATAQLDKWQIGEHYLRVAQELEAYWDRLKVDLGLSSGGVNNDGIITEMPAINVATATRYSKSVGGNVYSSKIVRVFPDIR